MGSQSEIEESIHNSSKEEIIEEDMEDNTSEETKERYHLNQG